MDIRFSFECSGVELARPRLKFIYVLVLVLVLAVSAVGLPVVPELLVIGW